MKVRSFLLTAMLTACGSQIPEQHKPLLPQTKQIVTGDFNLRVSQSGQMLWNGAPITFEQLRLYARQFGAAAPLRLVVQFESDKANSARDAVLSALVTSDTCQQGRCAEAAWNAPRPRVVS